MLEVEQIQSELEAMNTEQSLAALGETDERHQNNHRQMDMDAPIDARRMERDDAQPPGPMLEFPPPPLFVPPGGTKRPIDLLPVGEGDKKRAKRLFGNLLGTLARAQKEGEATKETSMKRAEIQKRAEERQKEERERLQREREEKIIRERAKAAVLSQQKLRHLNLQTRIKRLELDAAARIESKKRNTKCGFLMTASHPSIFWKPRIEGQATDDLRQHQMREIDKQCEGILQALEDQKRRLTEELKGCETQVEGKQDMTGAAADQEIQNSAAIGNGEMMTGDAALDEGDAKTSTDGFEGATVPGAGAKNGDMEEMLMYD